MKSMKLLTINIFVLNSFIQINKITAEEIKIKSISLNQVNNIQYDNSFINNSLKKFNSDILKNNISNTDINQNLNKNFRNNNSINFYKDPLQEEKIIKNINVLKNSSNSEQIYSQVKFKSSFKDLSNTFLSPYGGHVPRAPDESLKDCKTKECYE
tara:strand:- start:853 stop:1317 length:465 start_codon:yes stop_codon:yes gene_type:complete